MARRRSVQGTDVVGDRGTGRRHRALGRGDGVRSSSESSQARHRYLQVTFRMGQPVVGYLYLPRVGRERSVRSVETSQGLVVDFADGDRPIGIEITSPRRVTLSGINRVLRRLAMPPLDARELAPIRAA